jgi:RNA polymerase sigma-70 factor (ECF subfamily)
VTVTDNDFLTEQFEQHRDHLHAVAYRMLGSPSEADDAVQECWLRFSRADSDAVMNLGGWLTTVVGRISLDMLRARRSRREDYVGSWLPEPTVQVEDDAADPAEQAVLADSVGVAMLVVLETLTPAERLAFVLHDMFGVPFDEIAPIVDRSPAAARQLASRARRRVRGAGPSSDADLPTQQRVVDAFLAASRAGDFDALLEVLDPDVVFRIDAGRIRTLARPPIVGAPAVAGEIATRGTRFAPFGRPAIVNGRAGVVVSRSGRAFAVASFTVRQGKITAIDLVVDPDKVPSFGEGDV